MPDDHQNAGENERNYPPEPAFSLDTGTIADPLSHNPDVQSPSVPPASAPKSEADATVVDADQPVNAGAAENSAPLEKSVDNNLIPSLVSQNADRTIVVGKYKGKFPLAETSADDNSTLPPVSPDADRTIVVGKYKGKFPLAETSGDDNSTPPPASPDADRTIIVEKYKGSILPVDLEDDADHEDSASTAKRLAVVVPQSQSQVQVPAQDNTDVPSYQDVQEQPVASASGLSTDEPSLATSEAGTPLDFADGEELMPDMFLNTNHLEEIEIGMSANDIEKTETVALPDARNDDIEKTETVALPDARNDDTEGLETYVLPVPLRSAQPTEVRGGRQDIGQSYASADFAAPYLGSSIPSTRSMEHSKRHRKILVRYLSRKRLRQDRVNEKRSASRLWTTILSTFTAIVLVLLILIGAGSYAAYVFYNQTRADFAPKVDALRALMPLDNLKMYDSNGVFLYQMRDQGLHTTVKLNQISKDLVNATVATEDKNFWTNPGVDINRILQSALDDLSHGHVVAGGSTITQQLIKNLVIKDQNQTYIRKLQELVLTPDINTHYSKNDIMEMYLNSIYYGELATGIDAAATAYFGLEDQPGKPASAQLSLAQAVMLAGIPNSPTAFDPWLHPQAAFNRFEVVLDLMVRNNYITRVQAVQAITEEQKPDFLKSPTDLLQNRAPHFVEFVLQQLQNIQNPQTNKPFTRKELSLSGMSVYTTLDITLQDKIQKIMQNHIADLKQHNASNAAEVLMDFHTGAIISLLGSIDPNNSSIGGQFDVATQGYRQPGSSFKPFVYVTAFEQGASPAQAIDDSNLSIAMPYGQPVFAPKNYDLGYHGPMTLRCALQNSLNVPAVKVLQHVGIDAAMKTAKDMGIENTEGVPGLSLVLGGLGVHLLDETSAYGTFADGGVHVPYYAVNKIVFPSTGQTATHPYNAGTQAISPQLAYMMTNVLSDNTSRLPEFFDCNVLQLFDGPCIYGGSRGTVRPAAAKTGTTNSFKDNWTMGYTTDFVMGVWAGNNNGTPMTNITGVAGAAPIWHDSMLLAEQGHPVENFVQPPGLQSARVTYPDGVTSTDLYLQGHVPSFKVPTSSGSAGHPYCSTFNDAFGPINTARLNGGSSMPNVW